jgi:hypothetical protein
LATILSFLAVYFKRKSVKNWEKSYIGGFEKMPAHIALVGFLKKPQKNKGSKKAEKCLVMGFWE